MRKYLLVLLFLLLYISRSAAQSEIYTYTSATNGTPAFVAANVAAYSSLYGIGTGTNTPCSLGFSGLDGFTNTTYSSSNPCINVTVTAAYGYLLNITGFAAGLRRSGTGPGSARFAYSTDGGSTWVDDGVNHAPYNGSCATSASGTTQASWTTSVLASSVMFRIYPFSASSASGTLQIFGLHIYGTVIIPASPTVTNNSPVCAGDTIKLNASSVYPGAIFSWSGPNGFSAIGAQVIIPNAGNGNVGTYSVYVIVNGTNTPATTTTVAVNPLPVTPTISSNTPLCSGNTLNLASSTITNPVTYSWSGPNGFINTSQNPIINNVTVAATGVYTDTVKTVAGCKAFASTSVVIDSTPNISSLTFTNTTACNIGNGTISLYGLMPFTIYNITFSLNGSQQPSLSLESNAYGVITITGLAAAVYNSITANTNSCTSAPVGPVTISNPPLPATPIAGSNSPVCSGSTINLTANSLTAGVSYNWTGPNSFFSSLQNPSIPNATAAAAGVYSVTATAYGCISPAAATTMVINSVPVIGSIVSTNPTTCSGTQGTITLNGLSNNTGYTVYYVSGSITFNANLTSNSSGQVIINNLGAGSYNGFYVVTNTTGCTSAIYNSTITLTDPTSPVPPNSSSNSPICSGSTINLFSGISSSGFTYSWIGPGGYTSSIQNPIINNATVANTGNYTLTVTSIVTNCTSLAGATTVTVNQTPAITSVTGINPTTCTPGNNGKIALAGLLGSTPYAYSYTLSGNIINGSATSNAGGIDTISGLSAGTCTNISVSLNNCQSATVGPVTLINPALPATPTATSNSPVCSGNTLNLFGSDATSGVQYNWTGPVTIPAGTQNPVITNVTTAAAGIYSLTVTSPGTQCTSLPATMVVVINPTPNAPTLTSNSPICSGTSIVVTATNTTSGVSNTFTGPTIPVTPNGTVNPNILTLNNATVSMSGVYTDTVKTAAGCSAFGTTNVIVNQTPSIATVTGVNPTTCNGTNGYILLSGLSANTTYAYSYNSGSGTATTSAAGVDTIKNLGSGTYNAISVTLNNCQSTAVGPITITNPALPATPSATSNSPVCSGNTLNLSTPAVTNVTYNWTGPVTIPANTQNPSITNVTTAASGTYTLTETSSITQCISLPAATVVVINPTPVITSVTGTNPTTCAGTQGTIIINGLTSGSSYNYTYNSTNSTNSTVPATANSSGQIIISGLGAGIYTNISVSSLPAVCSSAVYTGTITLVNPNPPAIPVITSNSPLCSGGTLTINASDATTGVGFSWTGPNGFSQPSNNSTVTRPNAITSYSGTYMVTASLNGCTSTNSVVVEVDSTPVTPTITTNSPVCSGNTITLTGGDSTNLTGLSYGWTGPNGFTSPLQSPSIPNAIVTDGGTYNLIATLGNCASAAATATVVVDSTPVQPTLTSNGPICSGNTLTVTANDVTAAATYTWTVPDGTVPNGTNPVTRTNAITAYSGTYTAIAHLGICPSVPASIVVEVDSTPVAPVLSSNSPVCSGNTVNLTATDATTGVTFNWTNAGGAVINPTITNATVSASGTYTATATLGSCTSAAATAVVVVDSTPVIAGVASANPITCTGTQGTITLTGLIPGNTYTIHYTQGAINNSQIGVIADNTGQVTLTGLPAGTYGSFIVVAATSCSSAVYIGPVSLVDPTPPATPTATNNGPVCSGNTLSLDAASTTNGVSYVWSGPDGFTSHASDTMINNTIVANSGTYSVVATLDGCTSSPGTTVVVIDSTPHLTAASFNNPTSCQGSQGSITLSGLTTGTSYTIHYTSASGIDSLVSQIANGSGQVTVSSLSAGAYNGFYVVNTATGCTSDTLANTVTLSDPLPPAPPVLTSNSPVCSGTTLTLHASSTSTGVISYVWNGPNGFNNMPGQDQTINNATTAASGTYTATATLNNCTSLPSSKNIVVDSTPVITFVTHTNPSTCLGAQGMLTVSGGISGTTYVVTYTLGGTNHTDTLTANNIGQVTVTGLTAGNYTNITIRNAATGCTSLSNTGAVLTDPAPPAKPDAGADQTLCSGSTLTLTSSDLTPNVSYMWNGPNGFISHSQDTTRTNALVSYSGNYIVKATLNNCYSYDTMAVVVDSTPITPIAGTQTSSIVCSGNIITLAVTSSNGATFSWSGPDGFTAHTGDTTISNAQAANAGSYTVTASNGMCTSAATTINIVVNPTPDAPIVHDTVYCLNSQAAPLSAVPNTGLTWYSATQQSLSSSYTPPTDVATTLTYYATQTVNSCTSFESLPLHVQINPLPPMPDTVANGPLCQYGMMTDTLAANGLYSDSLRWYNAATGGISTTPPVPSTDESGYQYYYVTQTHLGCESPRASDIVYVTPKSAQPLVNPSYYTYCQGETAVQLSATPTSGLTWYIGDTTLAGTLTPPVPSTTDSGIINYYVTETMNGCTSYASDIVVHTSARPVVVITSSKSYGCQFDTLTFISSGSTPPGSLLNWTIPSNDVLISGDTTTNNPAGSIVVRFDSAGPQDIILTVSNGNACTSADTFSFNVVAPPVALQKVQGDACPGDVITVALSSVSSSVRNYDWSFGDAMVLSGAEGTGGPYKIAYSEPGVHFITLKVTSGQQCPSITMTDTVVVHANPEAVISSVSANAICSGDSVKLGAKGFDAGYSYLWSPVPYFSNNSGTDVWAVVAQSGYLTLKVTSEYGCMAYDSTLVTTQPCCGVYFPNAFTPNGDTHNDEFGVVSKGHHKIHIFRIANRWGQTVFETADEKQKWDGTFNGVAQEMGTYDYYIKYDCDNGSTIEQKGQVMLVR